MISTSTYDAGALGTLTLAAEDGALIGLWMEGQKYFCASVDEEMVAEPTLPVLVQAASWLDAYRAGKRPDPTELALSPRGSAFRQRVWDILLDIPFGQTATYGQIAARLEAETGKRASAQAIGGAVGHNPISIIIPCHRVIGADGSLTGYAGGVAKKLALLAHEGVDTSRLIVPKKGTAL